MTVENPYPERIAVGGPPYGEIYVLRPGQLLIEFVETATATQVAEVLGSQGLLPHPPLEDTDLANRVQGSARRWVDLPADSQGAVARRLLSEFRGLVTLASPIYAPEGSSGEWGLVAPDPGDFTIELEDPDAVKLIEELGLVHDEESSELMAPLHRFRIGEDMIADDGFELALRIQELDAVRGIEFNWLILDPYQQAPQVEYWGKQWNLQKIGFPQAWSVETGSSGVWVAVIDSGFDLDHPDIVGVFTPQATRRNFTVTPATDDVRVPPTSIAYNSWHGTAVTGIIGASLAATGGVAGVAGGCRILAIRVRDGNAADFADGVGWAVAQGAKVINFSQSAPPTAALQFAINKAFAADPDVVICAAAGNGWAGAPVRVCFPARHVDVIAVGACDQNGRRKDLLPGEEQWFSQYGGDLDVMAPGISIPSTDYSHAQGYNQGGPGRMIGWYGRSYLGPDAGDCEGDYLFCFTGTSAAVAQVSGLAALLRSQHPGYTRKDVKDRIESTCEKTGGYPYATVMARPNGTWYFEMGYGCVRCDWAL